MRKLLSKRVGYAVVASTLVASLAAGSFLFKFDSNKVSAKEQTTAKERLIAKRNEEMLSVNMNEDGDENETVRAVVSLKKDSVMDTVDDSTTEYSKKLKKQENKILDSQEDIIKKAEKITGNKVVNQTAYLVNSFSIDATRKEMKELAKLSGVEAVYESSTYEPQMDDAVQKTTVAKEWESEEYGYTGEGTVVAVLDTGINYEHQDMVLDEGVKTKYTKEEWEDKIKLLGYGAYKTDKVPFTYAYDSGENDSLIKDAEQYGQFKSGICHGYHVAGMVAANGQVKGVAKNAQIIGMKLKGETEDVCFIDTMIRAIEDAVKLGADVINMSLGTGVVALNDIEYLQQAVNNAAEAGVVCCISAANSGTSSGLDYVDNILERKDTSTVNTPSTAKASLSVAAADTIDSGMAYFSSWGPATDLTLKPEIAAPGVDIKSTLDGKDQYTLMSGTSMASPFTAGCTAVLKNAVNEKKLGLEGKELNLYLKNCLMNTADPIIDEDKNVPYSVRYQGAGMVDVYGAVSTNVIATVNGDAKVELKEMSTKEKKFTITLKNYGDKDASYVLNNAQVYTDKTVNTEEENYYGIEPVAGASITFDKNNIIVPAKGSVDATGTVKLSDKFENNQYVESFISFEGQGVENIGLPVLGFYGDWSEETIIDKSIYDEGTSVLENYLGEKVQSKTGLKESANTNKFYGTELTKEKYEIEDWDDDENDDTDDYDEEELSADEKLDKVKNNLGKSVYDVLIKSGITKKALRGDKEEINKFISKAKRKPFGLFSYIKPGKTKAIKNVSNGYGVGIINTKDIDAFTLNIETNNMIEYSLLDLENLVTMVYGFDKNTAFKNFEKEFANEDQTGVYILLLRKSDNTTKKDIIADVTVTETDGSNCYVEKEVYDGEKVAFSPNKDGICDIVVPSTTNLRSSNYNNIYVLDSNKNKIRTLAKDINSRKVILLEGVMYQDYLTRPFLYDSSNYISKKGYIYWDGKVYDSTKGKYVNANEGQYYIQIESRIFENSLPQIITMPVKIDTTKPTVEKYEVREENNDTIVTFKVSDNVGVSQNYYLDTEYKQGNVSKTATYTNTLVDTKINEDGEYELNLGNIADSKVTFMFEDKAGNEVFVSDEVKEDVNDSNDNIISENTDKTAPVISVVDNKKFKKMVVNEDKVAILLKKKFINTNKYDIQVKVEDENIDENSFAVALNTGATENVKVVNEGNGLYTISFKKIDLVTLFDINVQDKNGNISSISVQVYKNILKFPYDISTQEEVLSFKDNAVIVSKDKINPDGTYTVNGKVSDKVESLKLGDQVVEINPTTREFCVNVPIKKGMNLFKFITVIDDTEYEFYKTLYYDDINILLDTKNIKISKNNIITTTKDTVELRGEISSYISLNSINVNGENIYSNIYGRTSTGEQELKVPFATTVKLNKGMNKVLIEAKNMAGQIEKFTVTVNYK